MRSIARVAVLAVLAVGLAGCGDRSTPPAQVTADDLVATVTQTGSVDKAAVHDQLTGKQLPSGVTSDEVFASLLQRHWDDGGAGVGTVFAWIGEDARSTDPAAAERAGETATALARYLADHASELLNIDGARSDSLGQVNPKAAQGITTALTPYLGNLAGFHDPAFVAPAFTVPSSGKTRWDAAVDIVSVLASDATAASQVSDATFSTATGVADSWVRSALDKQTAQVSPTQYGVLCGLLDRGLQREAEDRTRDKFGDEPPAARSEREQPYVDYMDRGWHLPDLDLFRALQTRDGIVEHDPRYDQLFDASGKLKDTATLVNEDKLTPETIKSDLVNIINAYRGGIMENPARTFRQESTQGLDSVQ